MTVLDDDGAHMGRFGLFPVHLQPASQQILDQFRRGLITQFRMGPNRLIDPTMQLHTNTWTS